MCIAVMYQLHCSFRNNQNLGPAIFPYLLASNLLEASCVAISHTILCEKQDLTKMWLFPLCCCLLPSSDEIKSS